LVAARQNLVTKTMTQNLGGIVMLRIARVAALVLFSFIGLGTFPAFAAGDKPSCSQPTHVIYNGEEEGHINYLLDQAIQIALNKCYAIMAEHPRSRKESTKQWNAITQLDIYIAKLDAARIKRSKLDVREGEQ